MKELHVRKFLIILGVAGSTIAFIFDAAHLFEGQELEWLQGAGYCLVGLFLLFGLASIIYDIMKGLRSQ